MAKRKQTFERAVRKRKAARRARAAANQRKLQPVAKAPSGTTKS